MISPGPPGAAPMRLGPGAASSPGRAGTRGRHAETSGPGSRAHGSARRRADPTCRQEELFRVFPAWPAGPRARGAFQTRLERRSGHR